MYGNITQTVSALWALLLVTASPLVLAQEAVRRPIEIRSVEISVAPLAQPRAFLDIEGVEHSADEVYIVELRGDFGEIRAIPVEIYIGNYKVEEYGGTENGIYFKVYDPSFFDRLDDQPFAYGFQGQRVKELELRFTPNELRPFARIELPKPMSETKAEARSDSKGPESRQE